MILEAIQVGQLQVNCYILAVANNSKAIIIDPGEEKDSIERVLSKHSLQPGLIINTHGHIDHIGCDDKFGVSVYVHKLDAPLLKNIELNLSGFLMRPYAIDKKTVIKTVEDKDIIELGEIKLEVIHTPGHTKGGICLLLNSAMPKILFTGDSLFYCSIGRTDFPGASQKLLVKAIKDKLLKLPLDTVIYPGHGPSSTLGAESRNNPFIN